MKKTQIQLKHKMLGWWDDCPSDPEYYIEDCRISYVESESDLKVTAQKLVNLRLILSLKSFWLKTVLIEDLLYQFKSSNATWIRLWPYFEISVEINLIYCKSKPNLLQKGT